MNTPFRLSVSAIGVALAMSYPMMAVADDDPSDRVTFSKEAVGTVDTQQGSVRVVQLVGDLEHPWSLAWLPDGRKLVTERPGRLLLIDGDSVPSLSGLPKIDSEEDQLTAPEGGNQGGLLDVAVHPDYENNGWIYFTYSSPGDNDSVSHEEYATGTALARARLNEAGDGLTELETLYVENPRKESGRHYGSRIVFPGDGSLIFSIGDRGVRRPSQDLTDPGGSMIRLYEDGGAHEDNPFVGQPPGNLRPEIYSFGHRNNQALAFHPDTGELWTAEHGPDGGDLLHRVEAGNNYGWPMIAYGAEYDTGEQMGLAKSPPGVETPVYIWEETMAPSGMSFYSGEHFADWQGDLFVGSLYREQLHRLVLSEGEVSHKEVLLDGTVGRIRDVRQGPDGYLYVVTDQGDGGVYRLEPAS